MPDKIPVGILGATGMVGQRFVSLLAHHPWFEIKALGASSRSAGRSYREALQRRNTLTEAVSEAIMSLTVQEVEVDRQAIAHEVAVVFCALDMDKEKIREIEEQYAALGVAVISNNSAHRWTEDVPMLIPEINPQHTDLIATQRKNRGWDKGLIVVKPNCSLQSYVPALHALRAFQPEQVIVSTYQALSGAGKTLVSWPEMQDNVIPFIKGEEAKSEEEPLKIWGELVHGKIKLAKKPVISAQCVRVPVSDGHLATVQVKFKNRPQRDDILAAWRMFDNPLRPLKLPSAPEPFITYFEEEDRPQTRLDRDVAQGMGISLGRLREDSVLDWKFVALSHNTVRGAAGGGVLTAELLRARGLLA